MYDTEGLRARGGSAGGIGGSGVFGLFGTVVQCKSDDNSWYCMLAKLVNVLIMLIYCIQTQILTITQNTNRYI